MTIHEPSDVTLPSIAADDRHARDDVARLGVRELLGILAFWTFVALLSAAGGMLGPRGRGMGLVPGASIAVAFLVSALWAAITPAVFAFASRVRLERPHFARHVLVHVAVAILVAIAVEATLFWLRRAFVDAPAPGAFPRRGPRGGGPGMAPGIGNGMMLGVTRLFWLDDLMVYFAVLAAGVARDYFLRYQARLADAVRLEARAAGLQAQLGEARLASLRQQLDPHFLFNTLNAISALVERDPRGVRRMIARLSELLRHSLAGSAAQEVTLDEELAFLERYLEIMRIRFQGRLEVVVEVPAALRDALVPNLVLQPLVENAIKHGVDQSTGAGRVAVRAALTDERVVLEVRDDGPGVAPGALETRDGVGLRNTRDRLAQLYGTAASLALEPAPAGGTVARVTLPYHTGADLVARGEERA